MTDHQVPLHKFREACIRCSFLQVEPTQSDRLAQIESDLTERIDAAREQSRLGDVEQLQLTLNHLHDKQDQVQRLLELTQAPALVAPEPTLTLM